MYQDFPKTRIMEIREECGVLKAEQTRMELLELIGQEKDQGDLAYIFSMLDEAEAEVESCRAKARAQIQHEINAWNAEQDKKAEEKHKAEHEAFTRKLEEAKANFMAWLATT